MFEIFKKAFILLSKKDRFKLIGLISSMVVVAIVEVIGIASIFPFIAVLSNPSIIEKHHKLAAIYHYLNFSSVHAFMLFLGCTVLTILVLGNLFSVFTMWRILKFTNMQEHVLSSRLLQKYLAMPYEFFLQKNPSELVKNVFSEVMVVTNNVFVLGMQLLAKVFSVMFISGLLIAFSPLLALIIITSFVGTYLFISLVLRRKVLFEAKKRFAANQKRFKIAMESLNAIQDIKVMALENFAKQQYEKPSAIYAHCRAVARIIAETPKYFLEIIAFGGILFYLLIMLSAHKNITQIIPLLSMYAFAGLRLMPALHLIYNSFTEIKFGKPSLDEIYKDLNVSDGAINAYDGAASLIPCNNLSFERVCYTYPAKEAPVLNEISLTIPVNKTFAFVGETGSGKTTAINLLLGLLKPSDGTIKIDNAVINDGNIRAWQQNIAFVPQNIYLTDDSIASNIAFGIPDEEIDQELVGQVARLACLHDFILTLPEGYQTTVGDRGVRLSGGQRQRIGIARALYRNTSILILDEATSALDNTTESKVLNNILNLSTKKTIIMIAHRLSTVEKCDSIYVLSREGRIVGQGRYEELLQNCAVFQSLAMMDKDT